ncbi:MAG: CHAT domain-containing protein [Lewinellaceae bacterium]|nr:CHAT domain-containing protein [Lewinellaceae bacterium]
MQKYALLWLSLLPLSATAQGTEISLLAAEVDSTLAVCDSLYDIGSYEEALALAGACEQKVLNQEGEGTKLHADCLYTLGKISAESGGFEAAEKYLKAALAIRKNLLGEDHEDYIHALIILGSNYTDMGSYEEAEPVLQNAVRLAGRALGKASRLYVRGLIFQGILYEGLGRYEQAERIVLEALSIVEEHFPEGDRFYTIIQNNLGVLYAQAGRYMECEQHFLISNTLVKEQYGENHLQFAGNLFNLGFLYDNTGRFAKAEECYLQSKGIVEQNIGKENFYYAGVANNLGLLYYHTGQLEEAERYFRESIEIRTKLVGGPHPNTATSINNLALVYEKMGRYEAALEQHQKALSMREGLLGKAHPEYAQSLSNLGNLKMKTGQYAGAESLYVQANRLWEAALGREHPHIAVNLISLGLCFSNTGRASAAAEALAEASGIQRRLLEKATRYLSENELAAYISTFHNQQDIIRSVSGRHSAQLPALAGLCYDNTLFYKGFLLNEAQRMRKLAIGTPEIQRQFELLSSCHRRLAGEYAKPLNERQETERLESQINELERSLANAAGGIAEAARQVSWREVQLRLPADGAAIEFIHYRQNFGLAGDTSLYAALLLRPGDTSPRWIPLCNGAQLDGLLENNGSGREEDINRLYAPGWGGTTAQSETLYRLLWAPLEEALEGARMVYFSPAGVLHRLNLGAIPDEKGRLLAQRFQMARLNSTRHLAAPSSPLEKADNALLYGGIRYEMDSTALARAVEGLPETTSVALRGELFFEPLDTAIGRGTTWAYLPGTAQEVKTLEKLFEDNEVTAETRMGYTATEEDFKQIGSSAPSPKIIHLATHGYFFPDPKDKGEALGEEAPFRLSEHPLIRSGLILAGGSHAWQGNPTPEGREDGILTAYEASRMDLSGTELVVLSACETGLGDIAANEGVYGLQRAFRIAGARNLILSLWKVPDRQTTELMEALYKKWLEEELPLRDALLAAQRHLQEEGWPPYYWAGFILLE